jgi:hypothetical protein
MFGYQKPQNLMFTKIDDKPSLLYNNMFCYFTVECLDPMGIENSAKVLDSQLLASTSRDSFSDASAGRLFNHLGAWVPQ